MADTSRSVATAPRRKPAVTASRRTPVVKAPRRKPGRGSQVTPAERREIQRLHLVDGLNQKQIAARTGRTRETIAAQLKGADFERIRTAVEADLIETVKRQLTNNVDKAANAWIKALDRAAEKGDHKPAKDLLMHAGVIAPRGETSRPQFVVVVGMPGHPAMEPPSQEDIDAEEARVLALRARQAGAIDVVTRASVDGAPQPPVARLEAPSPEPDTPRD